MSNAKWTWSDNLMADVRKGNRRYVVANIGRLGWSVVDRTGKRAGQEPVRRMQVEKGCPYEAFQEAMSKWSGATK